jgi:hypothetical protein
MRIASEGADEYVLRVSGDELRLIAGMLREICFGVPGFEFQARLGWSQEAVKDLAKRMQKGLPRLAWNSRSSVGRQRE